MWSFLSRGHGETEGYSNGSLAEFKGHPLQAIAREVCQNSLDAADGSGRPVIVEFETYDIPFSEFPGMEGMRKVIAACDTFWDAKGDVNTKTFLKKAKTCLNGRNGVMTVLRVSDFNTTGVRGAFSDEDITPWGSLVKGNAFSVKTDTSNAAGSYGIGKAAPFVSSYFQTVFYRTLDTDGVSAALGVARLMAHDSINPVPDGEDIVRRSVGYFGADEQGKPAKGFEELDKLKERTECGTDLFIPGFTSYTTTEEWIKEILKEVVENFLYSIYSGKLIVRVGRRELSKSSLANMFDFIGSKDAKIYYEAIRENERVEEITRDFHGLGTLRLRLLFGDDLNKKILVVRNSGMKIAKISSLPRMITYTGFLELQGSELNSFFRAMENPSHNAWEPRRHGNPQKAKEYLAELEDWVRQQIINKLIKDSGEEDVINVGDCFNYSGTDDAADDKKKDEVISNDTDTVQTSVYTPQNPTGGKISIRDEGRSGNSKKRKGTVDPDGTEVGTRHRSGQHGNQKKQGRAATEDPNGVDTVWVGDGENPRLVKVAARIISQGDGANKLIFTAEEPITRGHIEIVTRGENGKSLKLRVKSASGATASAEGGLILITDVPANERQTVEFQLLDKTSYAMGVKAYEYQK